MTQRSWVRAGLFRLVAALGGPALLLVGLELGVTAAVGEQAYPLPGLDEAARFLYWQMPERINPLFVLDESSLERGDGEFATRPGINGDTFFLVQEQRWPARRAEGGVRLAFLGGSSVQGWPFSQPEQTFAHLTGQRLQARFAQRRVDVVNAGVGSYNSFQLVDVGHQVAAIDPDVAVIYAAHNDQGYYVFQDAFLDAVQDAERPAGHGVLRWLNQSNLIQAARKLRDRGWSSLSSPDHLELRELPEPSNDRGAASTLNRSSWRNGFDDPHLLAHLQTERSLLPPMFERNLRDLVGLLRDEDTAVVLAVPVANLRDWRPTVSLHFDPIEEEQAEWLASELEDIEFWMTVQGVGPREHLPVDVERARGAWQRPDWAQSRDTALPVGSEEAQGRCAEVLPRLQAARELAPRYALTWFLLGTCLLHSDEAGAARAFAQAREHCPALPPFQRARGDLLDVVRRVGAELRVPVVDLEPVFAERAPHGVPGAEFFVDNLHFSRRGAELVAEQLAATIAGLPVFEPGWPRGPDPPGRDLHQRLQAVSREWHWGMGLRLAGAGAAQQE